MRLTVTTTLALLLTTTSASGADPALRIGVQTFKPVSSLEDGKTVGFAAEVFDAIAKERGWTWVPVACTGYACLERAASGDLDGVLAIEPTRDGHELADYTRIPLLSSWATVFAPTSTAFTAITDLAGKRVGIVKNSRVGSALVAAIARQHVAVELVGFESPETLFDAVVQRSIAGAAFDRYEGNVFATPRSLQPTQILFAPRLVHFAVGRDRKADLREAFDESLFKLKRDPNSAWATASARWLEPAATATQAAPTPDRTNLAALVSVVAALAFAFLLWRRLNATIAALRAENAALQQKAGGPRS